MNLKQENKILREKLKRASQWMIREVENSEKEILVNKTDSKKNIFLKNSREDIISREIYHFFSPNILMHFPENAIENIISSEIIFYEILEGNHVDGTGVVL